MARTCMYSGMTFRSNLEARWALIFDILGWDYDYEPAQYRITRSMAYVPDFFVYNLGMWVEVKGKIFLSRQSMAKIAAGVGGPRRLPSRTEPFEATKHILIGGDIVAPRQGLRPVHNLVEASGKNRAVLREVFLEPDGTLTPAGEVWREVDASGKPAARRPAASIAKRICEPDPVGGVTPKVLDFAYRAALDLRFDRYSRAVVPAQVARVVAGRWGGRPVACR